MFVSDFMTRELITAAEDDLAGYTLQRMREQGLRRMPVLSRSGELVGMITDRRLLQALAVPVRRGEFHRAVELPPPLSVGKLMSPQLFTVAPDTPLEEAAATMVSSRIGSLVVMEGGKPIGIITETDMFRVFLRLLGAGERGVRVTMRVPAFRGIQADIVTDVARAGGSFITLASLTDEDGYLVAFKVADMTRQDLEEILAELPISDVDIMET